MSPVPGSLSLNPLGLAVLVVLQEAARSAREVEEAVTLRGFVDGNVLDRVRDLARRGLVRAEGRPGQRPPGRYVLTDEGRRLLDAYQSALDGAKEQRDDA